MFNARFLHMLPAQGREGEETLDRPLSNFDVIGIPTGKWSSPLLPMPCSLTDTDAHALSARERASCLLACCCPCVVWAQIVVRAQIPLLIAVKNAFHCLRPRSGFGAFVEYFLYSVIISLALLFVLIFVRIPIVTVFYLLILLLVVVGGCWLLVMGHTRTAFKEKYLLPTCLPVSCLAWEMLLDIFVSLFCLPCSLSQMARHVFQYDRMDTDTSLSLGDPYALPPLRPLSSEYRETHIDPLTGTQTHTERVFERPLRADEAGLSWTDTRRHPALRDQRGAAHRQEEIIERQRRELLQNNGGNAVYVNASAPPVSSTQESEAVMSPVAVAVPINRV